MEHEVCIEVPAFEEEMSVFKRFVDVMKLHNEGDVDITNLGDDMLRICGTAQAMDIFANRAYMTKTNIESVVARTKQKLGDRLDWVSDLKDGYGVFANE